MCVVCVCVCMPFSKGTVLWTVYRMSMYMYGIDTNAGSLCTCMALILMPEVYVLVRTVGPLL